MGSERLRGNAGVKQRLRRLARTDGLCEDCKAQGRIVAATIVDHIVPLAKGGLDVDTNTRNLCDECNDKRTAEQFGFVLKQAFGVDGFPKGEDRIRSLRKDGVKHR